MAPSPQETIAAHQKILNGSVPKPMTGDEVVISGISGIFPESDSTLEFMENLFNKVDMVTEDNPRWTFNHPEVPKHLGKVNGTGKFDAQFFRVHYKQACTMEPMSRKLLEHAYSAIYDSGINPLQLRGKKVGVFVGSLFSESEESFIYKNIQRNGFGITGCNRSMYANRISYWIDGKGPSYSLDLACASSMTCLEHAYRSISTGQCEAAIVGGSHLCRHPNVVLNLMRTGFLCSDGKTKCFDKNGDGYVRADAISILFLQRAKDAKRIYSEVYHAVSSYCLKPGDKLSPNRDEKDLREFFEHFYAGINVSPSDVEYIEANGAATAEADGNELEAIGHFFGKDKPIKVGSVKSNMGHSEAASGLCAITKVCIAYHKGKIPANLHYNEPQDHLSSIRDGKVEVLKEHSDFGRGFAACNNFSYSGSNVHVLLKGHYKTQNPEIYKSNIPRLVLVSGRKESCVNKILETLSSQPIDPEQIGLLHNIHKFDIPGHMQRGYSILEMGQNNETVCLSEKSDYCSGTSRPIWFMYSGMGSQWAGMGADLMRIPIFAAAIHRCHKALEPKGINIVQILTEPDKSIYNNILNSFVGIAAVQIGLTDILREMGIVPDNIIGHSVGELGCAYADGCLTAEEMILSAYSRGLVSIQTPFIRGSMAAVGLGYKDVLTLCPPEIEVACHNSSESSTISGPADIMKKFVGELTSRGIFAKEVPCSNIAYHSKYIASAGPGLLKYLIQVIKTPKLRSEKWVSTSIPQDKWNEPMAKCSSAEYHTNNLLNSVLFEETAKLIPENALVIEVAPHGLLQAILKRSHSSCSHIPLTRRGHSTPVQFFLEAIGKLYLEGLNPQIDKLYPKIEFPVSTETPMLSHFVEWEHSEDWPQEEYNKIKDKVTAQARNCILSIHDDDYQYLKGYGRDGLLVFPESALLVMIWETLAMQKGDDYRSLSVNFGDVHFHEEATVKPEVPLRLCVMIHKGSHRFEVSHDGVKIVTGTIEIVKGTSANFRLLDQSIEETDEDILLTTDDVYKILRLRGFNYKDDFKTILSTNANHTKANIKWSNDWVTFLDSILQLNTLAKDYDGISTPSHIKKITINMHLHQKEKQMVDNDTTYYKAKLNSLYGVTRCAGVEIDNIIFFDKPKMEKAPDVLEAGSFIPHFLTGKIDMDNALLINLQLIADNVLENIIRITEVGITEKSLLNSINDVLDKIPSVHFELNSIREEEVDFSILERLSGSNVFVVDKILGNETKMKNLHRMMSKNTFVLTVEPNSIKVHPRYKLFNVITAMNVQDNIVILLNKANVVRTEDITFIPVTHDRNFSWVARLQSELRKTKKVVLVSERETYCGLLGMIRKLSKEYKNKIGLFIVDDYLASTFNPESVTFKCQIDKNLTINILKKGHWGAYYYIPIKLSTNTLNSQLTSCTPGDIDTLSWTEAPAIPASNTKVQVCFSGISFRDAQKAVGKVKSEDKTFGMDFSGINNKGERVMGVIAGGSIATTVMADTDLLWPVPDHWTLEDAATVPLPYLHAYYCLTLSHPLLRGHAIFVNGGAGAFGQAVISICLSVNCPVYTTVSTVEKKQFLLRLFPKLKAENITFSRHDTFSHMVLKNTNGKGCNIAISSLSGPLRMAAMKTIGFSGIFTDISDSDMVENKEFTMSFLCEERNYKAVNLSNLFKPEHTNVRKALQIMMAEGIAKGIVKPISRVVYSPNKVSRAFRLLSSSRHIGKTLIRMRDNVTMSQEVSVRPVLSYSTKASYVVICDEDGLGIELADRLVRRGAKKLILHLKQNSIGGYFNSKLLSWQKQNISVSISKENIQTETGCVNLLKEGTKLGPVEGIFFVQGSGNTSFEQNNFVNIFNETGLIVANLDLVSRKTCADLKHFAIITRLAKTTVDAYVVSTSEKICQNRIEVGLPALVFHVTSLDEFDQSTDSSETKLQPQTLSTVFNALETSLKLKYDNVISFNLKKQSKSNFFEKISSILGAKKIDDLPQSLTLEELNITEINIEEIRAVLKETHKINSPSEAVRKMTISSLKQLDADHSENTKFNSGLGAFYTFIDEDECMGTEPMIAMPTKLSNASEKEDELDPKATYLMLIPGFEGHHQIFQPVCERLKVLAMTFQLGPDVLDDSVQQMAASIMKFMKKRFELKSKFYLLGYSFGVNVALELAALMEKEGRTGIVYCLDSSPDILRKQLDAYVGNLTDTELQNTIAEHMYHLMTGKESDDLKTDLNKLENWKDKVEACVKRLRGLVNYSNQYKRSILESAYNRIKVAREYNPDLKLESEIVLMKGIPHPKSEELPEDYNLSKYTKQPVQIFDLKSDHAFAPKDCRVSNIVNKLLEPKVLEEFKKKNLCESYFTAYKML